MWRLRSFFLSGKFGARIVGKKRRFD